MTDEAPVPVPERLNRPHPFVTATRAAAQGLDAGDDGRLDIGKTPGVIRLKVSRDQLPGAYV